jgi:hypothetical protein
MFQLLISLIGAIVPICVEETLGAPAANSSTAVTWQEPRFPPRSSGHGAPPSCGAQPLPCRCICASRERLKRWQSLSSRSPKIGGNGSSCPSARAFWIYEAHDALGMARMRPAPVGVGSPADVQPTDRDHPRGCRLASGAIRVWTTDRGGGL